MPSNCKVSIVESIPDAGFSVALTKGSPFTKQFSEQIRKYKEENEIDRLIEKWLKNKCQAQKDSSVKAEHLQFGYTYLSGAFAAMIGGIVLSVVVLLMEKVINDRKNEKKADISQNSLQCNDMNY